MRGENMSFFTRFKGRIVPGILLIYDVLSILFSYFLALWLRFDLSYDSIPKNYHSWYLYTIGPYIVISVVIYYVLQLYRSIWRFAGYFEMVRLSIASIINLFLYTTICLIFHLRLPISYFLFGIIFQFLFGLGIRFLYRFVLLVRGRNHTDTENIPVLIFGAGNAGQLIAKDISTSSKVNERVVAFLDDNPNKWGRIISGIKVYGGRDDILATVDKLNVKKIYVAIPAASRQDVKEVINICAEAKCEVRNLPSMHKLYAGKLSVAQTQEVAIEDLLGREPIKVNNEEIGKFIEGKRVLITGAGGSIGSELSRQVAMNNPKQLILFDVYENGVYDVQLELRKQYPFLDLEVLIGSVRDSRRIFQVFDEYRPQIVYHAAAHKHVPLMEDSPCESIKNNSIGTYKTAFAAMVHGTERFVLISTDKAVNPTNIMGASKRLCEMIVQSFDAKIKAGNADQLPQLFTHWTSEDKTEDEIKAELRNCKTEFVAVRFGNVLGSNGSVIPIFKRQIAAGGPVTVTHPDIIRYFMTIPEAVSLVLQAGTYAHGGEIFVLDMGEPMKIDTLARNLIKLSGFTPDVDIKVEYTGLRPGEKLYEEKLMDEEGMEKTANDLIHIGKPLEFDHEEFLRNLDELMEVAYKNKDTIREHVASIVNTYHPI